MNSGIPLGISETDFAELDLSSFVKEFQQVGRVQVHDLFPRDIAELLFNYFQTQAEWSLFFIHGGDKLLVDSALLQQTPASQIDEWVKDAHREGAYGRGALYDIHYLGDQSERRGGHRSDGPLTVLDDIFNSVYFLSLLRKVTGIHQICRVKGEMIRMRSSHYRSRSDATVWTDESGKKCGNFTYSLTQEWRLEWGGLLSFQGVDAHISDCHLPCFNSLCVFTFPRANWISPVSPVAAVHRFTFEGSIFTS